MNLYLDDYVLGCTSDTVNPLIQLPLMGAEDLSCLMESLGPMEDHWHPVGPEWEGIMQLWHQLMALVWVLYARDKLSLGIRSFVRNSAAMHQVRIHLMLIIMYLS